VIASVPRRADVTIVGGGPAGAALAVHLARAGREVLLLERWRIPRWRASGVYSSPLTRDRLAALGLDEAALARLIRPIAEMRVESVDGPTAVLDYRDHGGACGVDRVRLERTLLDAAAHAGARVLEGAVVRGVRLPSGDGGRGTVAVSSRAGPAEVSSSVIVGADGPASVVARAAGVVRRPTWPLRSGLTAHQPDPEAPPDGAPMSARMVLGPGWYCGVAPVPGSRVNVGIVVPAAGLAQRGRREDPGTRFAAIVDALPGPRRAWQDAPLADRVEVRARLGHRVSRRGGAGWLLVGDAAGFLDPLSGEGLHRALVSAELAATALLSASRSGSDAARRYDRGMRARFQSKDTLSWLLQAIVLRPELTRYALRRLAERERPRTVLARALADLVPASAALDPRTLVAVLRP
jgi:flavin-dependent dehydrogenase